MTTFRVNNSTLLGGEVCAQWQANHSYALGARCVVDAGASTSYRHRVYECTVAGTSGSSRPSWSATVGATITDGSVTWTCRDPGDGNWDNAHCYLSWITQYATFSAGDRILVHKNHNETMPSGGVIIGYNGGNWPKEIYCVDKDNSDALAVGAVVQPASGNAFSINYFLYSYGVLYKSASGLSITISGSNIGSVVLESNGSDVLELQGTGTGTINIGNGSYPCVVKVRNAGIKFSASGQSLYFNAGGYLEWKKGTLTCPGGLVLILSSGYSPRGLIQGVDLSQIGAGKLVTPGALLGGLVFDRCKFPTDGSFDVVSALPTHITRGRNLMFHLCGVNSYEFQEVAAEGRITHDAGVYRNGGASDGSTPISHKMVSSANARDFVNPLEGPYIFKWVTAGSDKTFSVECIYDGATNLQNDEVWMELEYPLNNTDGLGGIVTDRCAPLGTPADKPASSEAWTNSMTNPNRFKCQVTVSIGKAGPVKARVCLAKASTTIYYDPMITES